MRERDPQCRTCDYYRWIAQACALDRDEIHDDGLLCTEWEPIRLTKRKTPT